LSVKICARKQLLLEKKLARVNRPNLRNGFAMKNQTLGEALIAEQFAKIGWRNLSVRKERNLRW